MSDPAVRMRRRRRIEITLSLLVLGAVTYLALVPHNGRELTRLLPPKVYRWFAEHDDFNNIAAFFVLGLCVFRIRVEERAGGPGGMLARIFRSSVTRLVALMALVCLFEFLQLGIQGRFSAFGPASSHYYYGTTPFRDIHTGFSGVFAAWLLSTLRRR